MFIVALAVAGCGAREQMRASLPAGIPAGAPSASATVGGEGGSVVESTTVNEYPGAATSPGNGGEGGGIDGGGGDFLFETPEEVKKIAETQWKRLVTKDSKTNLINLVYRKVADKDYSQPLDTENSYILKMLEKIRGRRDQLISKRLHFKTSGPCDGPGPLDVMASVSKLDMSGKVCFSLQLASRSGLASIRTDITALLIHEIAHLNGYGENDARRIQRFFIKHKVLEWGFNDREKKRMLANLLAKFSAGTPQLMNYDHLDSVRVMRRLSVLIASYFVIQDLLPTDRAQDHPNKYEWAKFFLSRVTTISGKLLFRWFANGQYTEPLPVNMEVLADWDDLIEALLNAEHAVDVYLFGDNRPIDTSMRTDSEIEIERDAIRKATDPKTLTNPSLRVDFKTFQWNHY